MTDAVVVGLAVVVAFLTGALTVAVFVMAVGGLRIRRSDYEVMMDELGALRQMKREYEHQPLAIGRGIHLKLRPPGRSSARDFVVSSVDDDGTLNLLTVLDAEAKGAGEGNGT